MSNHSEPLPEFGFTPTSLIDVLSWRATHEPDRVAYVFLADGEFNEVPVTYAELHRQAQAIAGMLQSKKISGQRCLLIYPPGLEFLAAFFGCLYAGVVAVPVYPPRKDKDMVRILAVINNSGTAAVLTIASIRERFTKLKADLSIPELDRLQWLVSDQTEKIRHFGKQWTDPHLSGSDIAFLQYTSGSTSSPKGVMISHGNLLYNQRMLTPSTAHTKDCILVSWLPLYHDMGLIGNILHPLYIGFKCYFMSPEAFLQKPYRWLQAISRYKATTTGGAPNFAFELCLNRITPEQRKQLDLSSWKFALVGSDIVRHGTLERFIEVFGPCGFSRETFYPAYGLAEATLIVSGGLKSADPIYLAVDAEALKRNQVLRAKTGSTQQTLVGCGTTLLDQKIVIVDPQSLNECTADQVGEIWVSGDNVARGYWNNEEQTRNLLQAQLKGNQNDLFLRTGDLGFLKDGELYITGRVKNLIVIRGRNHYPQDIESTVEESVNALRAGCSAAFTIEEDQETKLVIVAELERRFLSERRRIGGNNLSMDNRNVADRRQFNEEDTGISEPETDLELENVINNIRQAVAEHHGLQTHAVVLIRPVSLPKTTSGKIRRLDCRDQFLERKLIVVKDWVAEPIATTDSTPSEEAHPATADTIQSWLISKLAQELKLARHQIASQVELFRYGLDSLAAISIAGELAEWLKRPVSPTLFYNYPSVQALADFLAGHSAPSPASEPDGERRFDTPVAIIGAACRFPGADSLDGFWTLLKNTVDAINEVPPDRWDILSYFDPKQGKPGKMNTRWGGFIKDIDQFDPIFFGISPREAAFMDPQQRILLEVSWEAFENAGLNMELLAGTNTGVFIGISNNEYSRLSMAGEQEPNTYQGTGNALSIASNRISYHYDLKGPSLSLDTACSSSLVSVHMACQSLRIGESSLVVAGGVNLLLTPEPTVIFSQAGMMAGDGRCKTFDASADGYVRGEGCGLVVLKLLPDAVRDKDTILAVIRGSAVNQDGKSNGITAPNGPSQQNVIRQALKNAGVSPAQVSYIETHGTGTALGDPIEMDSLTTVLLENRPVDRPCLIGSVKTNIGHMEAAAGIGGLLKAALSVHHGQVPANLHFKRLNPHITLEETVFSIPVTNQPWPETSGKRVAGVSSFGFGGTNAHLILEAVDTSPVPFEHDFPVNLFTLSAKSESALAQLVDRYIEKIKEIDNKEAWGHFCFSANLGRTHFVHRLFFVCETPRQLIAALKSYRKIHPPENQVIQDRSARIVFIFPDHSAFLVNMGKSLYPLQPTFQKWIDRCHQLLAPLLKGSLQSNLFESIAESGIRGTYLQSMLFAIEYSLAKLWISWGIKPDLCTGSGVGSIVAAVLADAFNLETGLRLAVERDRLWADSPDKMDPDDMEKWLAQLNIKEPTVPILFDPTGPSSDKILTSQLRSWLQKECFPADRMFENLEAETYGIGLIMGPIPTEGNHDSQSRQTSLLRMPSLSETTDDWQQLLTTLGYLYSSGIDIDWKGFYRDYPYLSKVNLPTYPFQRDRYWIHETKPTRKEDAEHARNRYQLNWKPMALPAAESGAEDEGYWLIFTDNDGIGTPLAEAFRQRKRRYILVRQGSDYLKTTGNDIELDPQNSSHFDRLLQDTGSELGICSGIVYLWSINHGSAAMFDEKSLSSAIYRNCLGVVYLVQAMSRCNRFPTGNLWLVTSQTQPIDPQTKQRISIDQWPVWGLGKGIALEFPDLKLGLVDVDSATPETDARLLAMETAVATGEWQVAYRNDQRFVSRLLPVQNIVNDAGQAFRFKGDATYLITGGLGKLGLKLVGFLIDHGVRHIALVSRTALFKPDSTVDDQTHPWHTIQSFRETGALVHTYQADVSDKSRMREVFDQVHSDQPEIAGIFHAAGIVSKSTITDLSKQTLNEVLKAKVEGTWVLHQLSEGMNLDCLVLFSSISSSWGSREISHYAAANAFLDGFATYRQAIDLPVLSVNWGPWQGGGMTSPEEQAQMNRIGMQTLDADVALETLYQLLGLGASCQIVAAVDWSRFKSVYDSIGYGSLFSEIPISKDKEASEGFKKAINDAVKQGTWIAKLAGLGKQEKTERLSDLIRMEIARVMRCQPADINLGTGLFDLGMDSLMAVELKDILELQLDLALDVTLIFDYPNLNALTRFLITRLEQNGEGPTKTIPISRQKKPVVDQPTKEKTSAIKDLSEDEIARLIDEELEDI